MERLTVRFNGEVHPNHPKRWSDWNKVSMYVLAAYEDCGFSPEQLEAMFRDVPHPIKLEVNGDGEIHCNNH